MSGPDTKKTPLHEVHEGLGATVTERFDTSEDIHLILQDPEGNEFCLA